MRIEALVNLAVDDGMVMLSDPEDPKANCFNFGPQCIRSVQHLAEVMINEKQEIP